MVMCINPVLGLPLVLLQEKVYSMKAKYSAVRFALQVSTSSLLAFLLVFFPSGPTTHSMHRMAMTW
jgi:hypothetical protein